MYTTSSNRDQVGVGDIKDLRKQIFPIGCIFKAKEMSGAGPLCDFANLNCWKPFV